MGELVGKEVADLCVGTLVGKRPVDLAEGRLVESAVGWLVGEGAVEFSVVLEVASRSGGECIMSLLLISGIRLYVSRVPELAGTMLFPSLPQGNSPSGVQVLPSLSRL